MSGFTTKIVVLFLFITSLSFGQTEKFDQKYKRLLELAHTDLDAAKLILKEIQPLTKAIQKAEYNAYYFNAKGVISSAEENYPTAIKHYQKAYQEAKKWGDHRFKGIVLNNLGSTYASENTADKQIEYFELAKEEFLLANDEEWLRNVEYNLATAYYFDNQLDKALIAYQESEQRFFEAKEFNNAAYAISGQGSTLFYQEKYEDAIQAHKRAFRFLNKEQDPETHAHILGEIGMTYLQLNQLGYAKYYIDSALIISRKVGSILEQTRSYELLREYFKATNNLDSVLMYTEKAYAFGDSLKWSNYTQQFTAVETKFNTELKNDKIAFQEKSIAQQKANVFKLTILSITLGLLLIVIIMLLFRLNKRKHQIEIANNDKEVLLREIHHRVKNNMQVVSSLLNMHVRKVKDVDSKKILEDGSERIQAMALIQKNLYPHSDLKSISLNEYLHKLCHQLFENYNIYNKDVVLKTTFDEIKVDIDKLIPIGLIVNEILCNAVKHAFSEAQQGEISIKLMDRNENIQLELSDSGDQFPENWEDETHPSLGMKFIRIFSHKLHAKLTIQRMPNTLITLNFPKA